MRVSERSILPLLRDSERMAYTVDEVQGDHARAINANAGSAEIVEAVSELPNPGEALGRFYHVLGEQRILFAFRDVGGAPEWGEIVLTPITP